jgi:hypothetical protein
VGQPSTEKTADKQLLGLSLKIPGAGQSLIEN